VFVSDLLETGLEAGDYLRRPDKDFYRGEIPPPEGTSTSISIFQRPSLHPSLTRATSELRSSSSRNWSRGRRPEISWSAERLQALCAPAEEVRFVLRHHVNNLGRTLGIASLGASITLPTGPGTRIVAYQVGMDSDPDQDLEIDQDAGCSGQCWVDKAPAYARPHRAPIPRQMRGNALADARAVIAVGMTPTALTGSCLWPPSLAAQMHAL
jgi:hypothetical protein